MELKCFSTGDTVCFRENNQKYFFLGYENAGQAAIFKWSFGKFYRKFGFITEIDDSDESRTYRGQFLNEAITKSGMCIIEVNKLVSTRMLLEEKV